MLHSHPSPLVTCHKSTRMLLLTRSLRGGQVGSASEGGRARLRLASPTTGRLPSCVSREPRGPADSGGHSEVSARPGTHSPSASEERTAGCSSRGQGGGCAGPRGRRCEGAGPCERIGGASWGRWRSAHVTAVRRCRGRARSLGRHRGLREGGRPLGAAGTARRCNGRAPMPPSACSRRLPGPGNAGPSRGLFIHFLLCEWLPGKQVKAGSLETGRCIEVLGQK